MRLLVTKRLDHTPDLGHYCQLGAQLSTDGTATAAFPVRSGGEYYLQWYRSADEGLHWTSGALLEGRLSTKSHRAANLPTNKLYVGTGFIHTLPNKSFARISLSTDHATSFQTVAEWTGTFSEPNTNQIVPVLVGTRRRELVAAGQFGPPETGPTRIWAHSSLRGAAWHVSPAESLNSPFHMASALCATPGGTIHMGRIMNSAVDFWPSMYRSTDYGATFQQYGTLPVPSGATHIEPTAITAVTDDTLICAARVEPGDTDEHSGLWRSANGGRSWSIIPRSAIAEFPSSTTQGWTFEVYRLTKDLVILGLAGKVGSTTPPWRLSTDRGSTFPIVAEPATAAFPEARGAAGAIVKTKGGRLILCAFKNPPGATCEIWTGEIVAG